MVTLIPILIALSQNLYHEFLFRRTLNEQSFNLDNSLNIVIVGDSVSILRNKLVFLYFK